MRDLILFRGMPGSGKSTLAGIFSDCVYSTDQYFEQDGTYQFNPELIKEAHADCLDRVNFAMSVHRSPVCVANTFTQEWEMVPYFELANAHGYRIHTVVVENRHGSTSVHDVPNEKLCDFLERFDVIL